MSKKNTLRKQFSALTWSDLEEWAGSRIVGRGRSYQQQQRVSELSLTQDDALIAWVDGTKRYATKVNMDERGLPESICSCPYEMDCKHGVAVVLEYLKWMEKNRRISKAKQDDERLALLAEKALCDNESGKAENALAEDMQKEIELFLKDKTKAQLIDLICDLAKRHPEMAEDLIDCKQMISGNIKALVTCLRNQIHEIGEEPGWQNYWAGEGYTPDYSEIRKKLETLLKAGHADDVLTLGRELVTTGIRQVEESNDEAKPPWRLPTVCRYSLRPWTDRPLMIPASWVGRWMRCSRISSRCVRPLRNIWTGGIPKQPGTRLQADCWGV